VHRTIRDHDGEIRVEAPEGGGARFVLTLPTTEA
jgi:signal transduction histidine kinase